MSIIRSYEPAELQNKVEMAAARIVGGSRDRLTDPTRQEFQKRRELGQQYVEQLKAILTPEQFAVLPGAGRFAAPGELRQVLGKGKAAGLSGKGAQIRKGTIVPKPPGPPDDS